LLVLIFFNWHGHTVVLFYLRVVICPQVLEDDRCVILMHFGEKSQNLTKIDLCNLDLNSSIVSSTSGK